MTGAMTVRGSTVIGRVVRAVMTSVVAVSAGMTVRVVSGVTTGPGTTAAMSSVRVGGLRAVVVMIVVGSGVMSVGMSVRGSIVRVRTGPGMTGAMTVRGSTAIVIGRVVRVVTMSVVAVSAGMTVRVVSGMTTGPGTTAVTSVPGRTVPVRRAVMTSGAASGGTSGMATARRGRVRSCRAAAASRTGTVTGTAAARSGSRSAACRSRTT